MAERSNSALAQILGPVYNQAEDENVGQINVVLFQYRTAEKTLVPSHALEIPLPVMLWYLAPCEDGLDLQSCYRCVRRCGKHCKSAFSAGSTLW